jgi:UDP-N-acetylmuramoyl-tripeptide--D-alanyl-D-alanine ligase
MSARWRMSLEELVAGSGGRVVSQVAREYSGVGTDTRQNLTGQIFIALKGDNFDAHGFLQKAVDSGASALLVHRVPEEAKGLKEKVTIVEVDDTLKGLQRLATFWRRKNKAKILALTGTNGKTTTKEFTREIIGSCRSVHTATGSYNNHWGVPICLLGIEPSHEFAIVEMGMNHPGELTDLVKIAEPDVVMVTMVGRGHLEGVGSIDGVARAKSEIYAAASKKATMIFNLENPYTRDMYEIFGRHRSAQLVLKFSSLSYAQGASWPPSDVSLDVTEMDLEQMRIKGRIGHMTDAATIPVFGKQNINNLMAAASLALAAGLSPREIWAALPLCRTVWGRNQWVNLKSGARALFDGYNANPESMAAALENLSLVKVPGRKFAILGEMKELGKDSPALHHEMGEKAARSGFAEICFLGPHKDDFAAGLKAGGFNKNPFISNSYEETLAPRMLPVLHVGDIVLIKGSRGMALEKALMSLEPLDFEP